MMCISSPAGRRLAVARAQMRRLEDPEFSPEHGRFVAAGLALNELEEAAKAVAEELIAQRFHEMEGD